jgi:hypothetical protein
MPALPPADPVRKAPMIRRAWHAEPPWAWFLARCLLLRQQGIGNRRPMRIDRVGYLGWVRTPARARSGRAPFWILVAVTATGTLAMHILVPVLPLAAADFGVSRGTIQLAITLYLFGIAGGQLLYGPVSDKFGRRPTLLISLALYVAATEVGLYYLVVMSGVPIGSYAVSRLATRVRLTLLLRATSAIAVLGAALFFVAAVSSMINLATVLLPMILFSIGVGASGPVAITNAISTDPQMIGAASDLYGFMQMANGALCTLAVGFFPANPALSAASVLLAGILLGQYFFLCATRTRSGAGG